MKSVTTLIIETIADLKWKAILFVILFLNFSSIARATDFFVTSVIRDFPMKAGDLVYKDYYINAGSNNGLKKGAFIDAMRKMPVLDNINSKLLADTNIRIAKLKIIHIDKSYCVARLVKFYEKESTPATGNDSVMIGDLIEVSGQQN